MESIIDESLRKSRVFVTNYAGHDYTNAERYGEFVWVTKGYVSLQSLDRLKYTIAEVIVTSQAEDWLLLSGKPIISVIAALIWFSMHQKVKILLWDQKRGGKYREIIITSKNLQELTSILVAESDQ